MLLSIDQANARIAGNSPLIIAGSRAALSALKPGNWIGGSIPYFVTAEGGVCDQAKVYIDELRIPAQRWFIKAYSSSSLKTIATDAFENGFSYVIIPANTAAHLEYAMHAPRYPDIFMKPVLGWISGVHLSDLARDTPVVVDGRTGRVLPEEAIVLHVELPDSLQAVVRTVNHFRQGDGPVVQFTEPGFSASTAQVNGRSVDLVRFMKDQDWDARHPLVADYAGTNVNVSIKAIDGDANRVSFYAPVFPGVEYRMAAPVGDYVDSFSKHIPTGVDPLLSCNCILNYLYGDLEGRRTGPFKGPVTFGEIAHQLLNQTLVYLEAVQIPSRLAREGVEGPGTPEEVNS
jgi:hypothetical protein